MNFFRTKIKKSNGKLEKSSAINDFNLYTIYGYTINHISIETKNECIVIRKKEMLKIENCVRSVYQTTILLCCDAFDWIHSIFLANSDSGVLCCITISFSCLCVNFASTLDFQNFFIKIAGKVFLMLLFVLLLELNRLTWQKCTYRAL